MTSADPSPAALRDRWDSYEPRADLPAMGSGWIWERDKPEVRERITVLKVRWNGEEWWIQTSGQTGIYWNDVSRFWEACWPDPDPNDVRIGETIRWRGAPPYMKATLSGWRPKNLGSRRSWSKVGDDLWRRVSE